MSPLLRLNWRTSRRPRSRAKEAVPLVAVVVGFSIAASLYQGAVGFIRPNQGPAFAYCPLYTSTQIQVPNPGYTGNISRGAPYTYSYVFGDGSSSQEANVTHTYPGPGYYSGSLTIRDSAGHSVESYYCVNASAWPNLTVGSGNPAPACP
jgi:hypothetical protein